MTPKILFISKNFPPKIGGLETYSFELIKAFSNNIETHKITLSRSLLHLVWFLPYAFITSLLIIFRRKITHVHLCDAFLSPLGLLIKFITGVKVSSTVAGLDITFPSRAYQTIIPPCTNRLDKIIAISNATKEECLKRGIESKKISVIPVGINPTVFPPPDSPELNIKELARILNHPLQGKTIISTVGRLVERKGVYWFLKNVMPVLDDSYLYIIAGDGPDRMRLEDLSSQPHFTGKVLLLGEVTDSTKYTLLNNSQFFIMPNIVIPGDVEGFGIVALEAGLFGAPVIASNIQGIKDAVIDGETGVLVEEKNVEEFVQVLSKTSFDRHKVRNSVIENYAWTKIFGQYEKVIFSP